MTIAMTIATTMRIPHSSDGALRAALGVASWRWLGLARRSVAAGAVARGRRVPRACRRIDDGGGFDVVGHRGCSTAPILADPTRRTARGAHRAQSSLSVTQDAVAGRADAPRRPAPSSTSSGGATTVASGPRPTSSRSSQAGSLTASTTSHEPSLRRVADSCGWLSTTHSAAGASRSVTRGSSGLGWYTRSRSVVVAARRGVEVLAGRAHRAHAVDAEEALALGAVAPPGDVPGAERVEHAPRIDDARRHLVARERVVVDLDPLVVRGRVLQSFELVARADVDREAARARRSASSSFASAVASGPSASEPGTASSAASGGEQREAFGRCESQRSLEVLGEADLDATVDHRHVDEPVGGVRRQPAHREQLEVAFELALRHLEARRELGERDAGVREDPRHRARARAAGAGRRAGGSRARPPASGRAATASSHATMSARSSGGDSTSAWSSRSMHPRAERGAVHDRERDDDRAVGAALEHRLLAELVDHPAGARGVDEHVGVDRLVLAVGHGVGAHVVGRVDALGRRERPGGARARRRRRCGRPGTPGGRRGRGRGRPRTSARSAAPRRRDRGGGRRPGTRTSPARAGSPRRRGRRGRGSRRAGRAGCRRPPPPARRAWPGLRARRRPRGAPR